MKFIIFVLLFFNISAKANVNFEKVASQTYRKYDNTLTFHVTQAPKQLHWEKDTKHLIWSLVRNKYFYKSRSKRAMGHISVELNCSHEGKKIHRMGGQGAKNISQFQKHLLNGAGFNIMLRPEHKSNHRSLASMPLYSIDGKFEYKSDLVNEYSTYLQKKNLFNTITFTLDQKTCLDLVSYFDQYETITKETYSKSQKLAANNYGFGLDPLKYEGAGCAPFAEAFLKLAGLEDAISLMTKRVYVSKKLFSTPKKKVSLLKVLTSSESLSKRSDEKLKIEFPSPTKLYQSINKIYVSNKVIEKGILGSSNSLYVVVKGKE